jgi:hypothetical protein
MSRTITFDPFAVSLGISFVPVDRKSKRAYHNDWTNPDKSFPPETFKPDDNHGGRWGVASGGLTDLDCDTVYAARICEHTIRKGPRYGRRSNHASHYIVRSFGAKTKQFIDPITKKPIIELRSTGSQSVLPPSVHPSGEQYEWERQDDPPEIDAAQLSHDVGEIAACALLASLWKDSRHKFALVLAGFLAKNQVPQERATRLVTLITLAAQDEEVADRLRAVTDTYDDWTNGEDITANFTDLLGDNATVVAKTLAEWLGLELDRFRLHNEATLLNRPAAAFLVKGALVQGSLVALVSPPDFGKTFLALDLVLSVAAGEQTWLERALRRSGPVVYVIGEGLGRFKLRHLAWKQIHSITRALPFYWIDQAVPLLEEKAMRAFLKQAAPLRPIVIVFDTLSRCLTGGDENSASDMGMAMAACDELRARTKAVVLLLHHTKKDGTVERGSSALRGAVDTIVTLQEDADERSLLTLTCERQKDAEPFEPLQITRRVVQLDGVFDDDGNNESSCVIQLATGEDVTVGHDKRRSRILDLVQAQPGITKTKLVGEIGGRKADVYREIDALIAGTALLMQTRGTTHHLYVGDLLTKVGEVESGAL